MFPRKKLQVLALLLAVAVFAALLPATAFGAPGAPKGIYLVLDGIKGETRAEAVKDGIDILSFSFGAANTVSAGGGAGGGAGKPEYTDLSLMKYLDAASLPLLKNLSEGKAIKSGKLYIYNGASDKPVLTIDMKSVFVTSQQLSSSNGERPTESLSLKFAQATFTYNVVGPDGRVVTTQTVDIGVGPKG
ncbi:type VI secretion system tube protein Hcp [Paenibacillus sp. MWE-103]|uniref:Type VI secretion system tube protein Hcp n=1 Tax=Paenibacillus artemisiicola TaxID=1172618 RepID=A0ABS3WER5_9BACL|nr:type VI secretion system tube protein Hcp [Paenibacillus artemisiicola]MBO7746807.1 type VI secretion system tube protein Hcp [Paenibacillus artemisiicola]